MSGLICELDEMMSAPGITAYSLARWWREEVAKRPEEAVDAVAALSMYGEKRVVSVAGSMTICGTPVLLVRTHDGGSFEVEIERGTL